MLSEPKPMNLRVRRLWRFYGPLALVFLLASPILDTRVVSNLVGGRQMGLLDKLLGRGKKAAGDVMGDSSMRREGAAQERQGAAEERAGEHEQMAQEQRDEAAEARAEREST
jgi:uncharacterized protein YjbJ (UPF0337 family)